MSTVQQPGGPKEQGREMATMAPTIADTMERATNIQTREAAGDDARAGAFTDWLEQYRITRAQWATYDWTEFSVTSDGWETLYYSNDAQTLIRDQGGNCYRIPADDLAGMPAVVGGDIVGIARDDGEEEEDEQCR